MSCRSDFRGARSPRPNSSTDIDQSFYQLRNAIEILLMADGGFEFRGEGSDLVETVTPSGSFELVRRPI